MPNQEEQAVPMFCGPTSLMRVKQIWGFRVRTTIMILAQRALIFPLFHTLPIELFPFVGTVGGFNCEHNFYDPDTVIFPCEGILLYHEGW